MTQLAEFLFPAPAHRTVGGIVGWWERRRLAYNVFVGAGGLVTTVMVPLVTALPPDSMPSGFPPLVMILVVGVLANVCYCLGPAVEIVLEKLFGRQLLPVGPALYPMGLTFSVGLVLLPTLLVLLHWVVRLVLAPF